MPVWVQELLFRKNWDQTQPWGEPEEEVSSLLKKSTIHKTNQDGGEHSVSRLPAKILVKIVSEADEKSKNLFFQWLIRGGLQDDVPVDLFPFPLTVQ